MATDATAMEIMSTNAAAVEIRKRKRRKSKILQRRAPEDANPDLAATDFAQSLVAPIKALPTSRR
jgi:hypothetical protein